MDIDAKGRESLVITVAEMGGFEDGDTHGTQAVIEDFLKTWAELAFRFFAVGEIAKDESGGFLEDARTLKSQE